jgi:hypothetical protein
MIKKQKVIALCSSADFFRDVIEVKKQLVKLGFSVLLPHGAIIMQRSGNYSVSDLKTWFKDNDYRRKTMFINDHFKKIAKSQAILVVNNKKRSIDGYIGGATLMEMTIAHYLKKKIFIMNPVSKELPYYEEVFGLSPIIINGDLSKMVI